MSVENIFGFEQSYATELEGFYVPWQGASVPEPRVVQLNHPLAAELGLDADVLASDDGARLLAGMDPPAGTTPLAQAYAGHQFGNFVPQLGDGRALLLGELIDRAGARWDLQLKGSGRTPFSRGGDGKAGLGPVLREYLMSEAMHALGVPTTRALAAITTGEEVRRPQSVEPGAIIARVASSHIRVGTFQFFAARGESERVRLLAEYTIARHFPDLVDADDRYLRLLGAVRDRQAALVAHWMSIGFVHGVMNTDNTTVAGETIDYGPCAFMDGYDLGTVFSSIDRHGRYAYGNQPAIAQWNLARLAETLLPLIEPDDEERAIELATTEVDAYAGIYLERWLERVRAKLGLLEALPGDEELIRELFGVLEGKDVDFTAFFRRLSSAARGDRTPVRMLFREKGEIDGWMDRWLTRLEGEGGDAASRADAMDRVNPLYIPRNHNVQAALDAAIDGELEPFRRLLTVLARPFEERDGLGAFTERAPDSFGSYTTFCGT
ncbi:MAG: YdiU family protein [Gemmatimonadota bacterium]